MALMLFARAILAGEPIKVFNHGKMQRDATYIDDIVEGVVRCCDKPATANLTLIPFSQIRLLRQRRLVFSTLATVSRQSYCFSLKRWRKLGREAIKEFHPMQPGDVVATAADTKALHDWVGFRPSTQIDFGVKQFALWYCENYAGG